MARTKGTKQLGVELNSALLDEFKAFCEARGETVRKHLELAMRRHLDNPPPPPQPEPPAPPLPPVAMLPYAMESPRIASPDAKSFPGNSPENVRKAQRILKEATLEVVKAVEAGRMTLDEAMETIGKPSSKRGKK